MTNVVRFDKPVRAEHRNWSRWAFVLACACVLLAGRVMAQQAREHDPPQKPPQPTAPRPEKGASQTTPAEAETKVTPEQASELFRSVDEILAFASKTTRLPIKHAVKRQLASREQVRRYLAGRMNEDEGVQRLQRSEATLKKFGLIPRNFDLRVFMLELFENEVAGYYDPKTETVYLLDWVEPEKQRGVLAHELMHALQDQNFGLENWLRVRPEADLKDSDNMDAGPAEEQTARQAVSEGQAMVVLVEYILQPSGRSLADSPMMGEIFKQSTIEQTKDSKIFARAPLYLKEAVIFSYTYGLSFVQNLLQQGGKEMAFAGVFKKPPLDTRHIMQPRTYLSGEQVEQLRLPRLSPILKKEHDRYDVGVVGQFDAYVLLKQFADEEVAGRLAPKWRGGVYYLARKKSGRSRPNGSLPSTNELGLVYLSRWASSEDAQRFAAVYTGALPSRYKWVKNLPVETQGRVVAVPEGATQLTDEGRVVVEVEGDRVLVMEGFDESTGVKLRNSVLAREIAEFEEGPFSQGLGTAISALVQRFHIAFRLPEAK